MGQLASPLVTIVVAILSAYFAAYLAFTRFRREQLWQLKRKAYKRVLKALHFIEVSMGQATVDGDEVKPEIRELYNKGLDDVVQAVNVSSLVLPASSVETLQIFRAERWAIFKKGLEFTQQLEELRSEAEKARKKILDIARDDLKTNV